MCFIHFYEFPPETSKCLPTYSGSPKLGSFSNTDSPGYQHRKGRHFVRAWGQSPQGLSTQTLTRNKTQIHSIFTAANRKEHSITCQCPSHLFISNSPLIPTPASEIFLLSGGDRGKETMVHFQYLSILHLDL